MPDLLVLPVVGGVGAVDDDEQLRILDDAVLHLAGVGMHLPTEAAPGTGRRDHDLDRLLPRAHALVHELVEPVVRPLVQLVGDEEARVETVLAFRVAGQRLERSVQARAVDRRLERL